MKMKNKKYKIIFLSIAILVFFLIFTSLLESFKCRAPESGTVKLCTNYGDIVFETYRDDAPKTVDNFIKLSSRKFYDGLTFHLVKKGFIIQGGDPFCTNGEGVCGSGGPGFVLDDELDPDTFSAKQGYVRGVVAMANSGPDTNGSQFFIVHRDSFLPYDYTIIGKVISGQEIVDKMADVEVDDNYRPIEPIVINKVGARK